jgi:hypothetical protein
LGDTADVRAIGKDVYVGKNAGSDENALLVAGTLEANEVEIGALAGNEGNTLQLESTAAFKATAFRLAPDNLLKIKGSYTAINSLLTYLGTTDLQVWNGASWQNVNNSDYATLITSSFSAGYTTIAPTPEPTSGGLIFSGLGIIALRFRKR